MEDNYNKYFGLVMKYKEVEARRNEHLRLATELRQKEILSRGEDLQLQAYKRLTREEWAELQNIKAEKYRLKAVMRMENTSDTTTAIHKELKDLLDEKLGKDMAQDLIKEASRRALLKIADKILPIEEEEK